MLLIPLARDGKSGILHYAHNCLKSNMLTKIQKPSFNSMEIGGQRHGDWRVKATGLEGKGMEIEIHRPLRWVMTEAEGSGTSDGMLCLEVGNL